MSPLPFQSKLSSQFHSSHKSRIKNGASFVNSIVPGSGNYSYFYFFPQGNQPFWDLQRFWILESIMNGVFPQQVLELCPGNQYYTIYTSQSMPLIWWSWSGLRCWWSHRVVSITSLCRWKCKVIEWAIRSSTPFQMITDQIASVKIMVKSYLRHTSNSLCIIQGVNSTQTKYVLFTTYYIVPL